MPESERSLGLVLGSAMQPEQLVPVAVAADRAGLDELWFSEDCFFTGGISGAAAALASTSRVRVGLGVVSAMLRHPALLAMEVATISGAFPDRLLTGIGLGVPAWLEQVGRLPRSPVGAMTECVTAVRRLLAGERLDESGEEYAFADVALAHPARRPTPIYMGVIGPRMLRLSGEIADGSILSVCAGVQYLRWARDQVDAGRAKAGRTDPHRLTAFAIYSVDRDRKAAQTAARESLAFYLSAGGTNAITDVEEISGPVAKMAEGGGAAAVEAKMPEEWVDRLTVCGSAADCAERIRDLYENGADSVVLLPVPSADTIGATRTTAADVRPLLS
ncbi:MAG: LLM class flavin-dependent oxidoreductase [Acidimicrobiales bacterium]